MKPDLVFCIDGSGNKDAKEANLKRPIYELVVQTGEITRPILEDRETVFEYFSKRIAQVPEKNVLIAADLPFGLPESDPDVYKQIGAATFLEWLDKTEQRLINDEQTWREGLIADGVDQRTELRPFVSIRGGDRKAKVNALRFCDTVSGGESIYPVDHGGKQVGKAALQFWFEVFLPLKVEFEDSVSLWPFEPNSRVVIAECYPAECQRILYGDKVSKRNPIEVSKALGKLSTSERTHDIPKPVWIHAASSEDEFDMFTTALVFRELIETGDLFWHPARSTPLEGWMMGLTRTKPIPSTKELRAMSKSREKKTAQKPAKNSRVQIGEKNRNEQMNLGPSGNSGSKGPLVFMECNVKNKMGVSCGYKYETNPQEVFHKKCPACQGGK